MTLPMYLGSCGLLDREFDAGVPPDAGADAEPGAPDAALGCSEPPPPVCDYFLACGCDAATQKCSPGDDGPACFTSGLLQAGEVCAAEEDCSFGLTCTAYFGASQCMQLCDAQHSCPTAPEQACYVTVTDHGSPPQAIGTVCGQVCDLRAQDCTYEAQGCYPFMDVAAEHGICIAAGLGSQGDSCELSNDCAEGYICIDVSGPAAPVCAQVCDRQGGDPKCTTGTCAPLAGHVQTGICLTP